MVTKRRISMLILLCLAAWLATACSLNGRPLITIQSVTPSVPGKLVTTVIPSTKTLLPKQTGTEVLPGTPSPLATCFVTYYDPFAFIQGTSKMLVRGTEGVQIFNLQTMKQVAFIKSPAVLNGPSLTLSPDGEMLVWALEDGRIQAVRLSDQSVIYTIQSGQTGLLKLEFTPLGDRLYSASHDGLIKIWDNKGELDHILQPGGELMNIGISPDGTMLATIPGDGPVTLWSIEHFDVITELGGTGGYDTSDVAFSPDGRYLAADLVTGLYVWDLSDGKQLLGADHPINSMAVAYSPDGHFLAYSDLDKIILSSPDGSQVIRTLEGRQAPVFELLFSSDSFTMVSADDAAIRVWRVEDGQLLAIGKNTCP